MAWLYRQKDSKHWWIGWRSAGKEFRESTRTSDKKKAEARLRRQEAIAQAAADGHLTQAFIDSFLEKPVPQTTLPDAVQQWLGEAKRSTAPRTFGRYNPVLIDLVSYLGAPLLRDVTAADLRRFLSRQSASRADSTMNLHRAILKNFFAWCMANELVQRTPMLGVKSFKARRDEARSRRAFTLAEVGLLYAKAPDEFWRYMVTAGFYTGQRLGDLATLTWGSVDFDANVLRITQRKTGTALQIPMARVLRVRLDLRRAAIGRVKASDHVWPEQAAVYLAHGPGPLSNQFHEILSAAGLAAPRDHLAHRSGRAGPREAASVSFHCLRHTFVSALKIAGGSQAVAKELAGHSSNLVSDAYTHTGEKALQDAIAGLPDVLA